MNILLWKSETTLFEMFAIIAYSGILNFFCEVICVLNFIYAGRLNLIPCCAFLLPFSVDRTDREDDEHKNDYGLSTS